MEPPFRFSPQELTGRSRGHIVDIAEPRCSLHHAVVEPFLALRAAAARDGIDLRPLSSFRDFTRQLTIWNEKCRGDRELRDSRGNVVDAGSLDDDALVDTILLWSALPGASRHHWGTDMDVIDAAAMPAGYRAQLVTEEFAPGGVFCRLNDWLADHAGPFGFYRPYARFRGGVQPEPWHLSYAPGAEAALQQFSVAVLAQALAECDIEARQAVNRRVPQVVERYVMNLDAPPAVASRATRLA
jgi:LAS superfamily LD-carboxypeptidase LdcB